VLWPHADAVGQVVHLDAQPKTETTRIDEPRLESRAFTVIGVARDVGGFRIAPFERALVYVPASAAMPHTALVARVRGDPELARQTILNRLTTIDSNSQVATMLWVTRMEDYFLQLGFWFTSFSRTGLVLTLSVCSVFCRTWSSNAGERSGCAWRSVRRCRILRGWLCGSRSGRLGLGC
jgi:hypothetical protein